MAMHRQQRFDTAQPSVAVRDYAVREQATVLQALFRRAVGVALASTMAVTGCSAANSLDDPASGGAGGMAGTGVVPGTGGTGGSGGPVTPQCEAVEVQLLDGLSPAEPFDAAELRTAYMFGIEPYTSAASGTLCSKATDKAACTAAIAAAEATLPFTDNCGMIGACQTYVIATSGDAVRTYETREELLQLLGSIDTPQEVALLLSFDGFNVQCADPSRDEVSGGPGASTITPVEDGFEASIVLFVSDCPIQYARVTVHVASDGTVTELTRDELATGNTNCPVAGRRPEGLLSRHVPGDGSMLGEYFASMAHLEAASVTAFEVLAEELAYHGAPRALIDAALSAADDEVRHTARTTALARRFGAEPTAAVVAARPLRSLEQLALDNATEGCVRECFGAALGSYQAAAAQDPEIARAMAEIADDETRHAALAFELAAWVDGQLDERARARVAQARTGAVASLRAELFCVADEPTRRALGLPDAVAANRLHDVLQEALWAA